MAQPNGRPADSVNSADAQFGGHPPPGAFQATTPRRSRARGVLIGVVVAAVVVLAAGTALYALAHRHHPYNARTADAEVAALITALRGQDQAGAHKLFCANTNVHSLDDIVSVVEGVSVDGPVDKHGPNDATAALKVTATVQYELPAPGGGVTKQTATPTFPATVGLHRRSGTWCVNDFDAMPPSY